jgi:hypothetical protein
VPTAEETASPTLYPRWVSPVGVLASATIPTAAAFVVGLVWHFGRRVDPTFAATVSQILPVLFLAAVLESRAAGLNGPRRDADNERIAVDVLSHQAVVFAVGEGLALYSVASGARSTFLVLTPCLVMVWMLVVIRGMLAGSVHRAHRTRRADS